MNRLRNALSSSANTSMNTSQTSPVGSPTMSPSPSMKSMRSVGSDVAGGVALWRRAKNLAMDKDPAASPIARSQSIFRRRASQLRTATQSVHADDMKKYYATWEKRQKSSLATVKQCVEEYIDVCLKRGKDGTPPNMHSRFTDVTDGVRQLGLKSSQLLEANMMLKSKMRDLIDESSRRLNQVATALVTGKTLKGVVSCTAITSYDGESHTVVQQWGDPHAAKVFARSLKTLMNMPLCNLDSPFVVVSEVFGRTFVALSICPLAERIAAPLKDPLIAHYLDMAVSSTLVDAKKMDLKNVAIGRGLDGRIYVLDASPIHEYLRVREEVMHTWGAPISSLEKHLNVVAIGRAARRVVAYHEQKTVNDIMHAEGLPMAYLRKLYEAVVQHGQQLAKAFESTEPVTNALSDVAAEIIARVLKIVLREHLGTITPTGPQDMAEIIVGSAQQAVSNIVYTNVQGAKVVDRKSLAIVLDIAKKRYDGKTDIVLEDEHIEFALIAQRLCHFMGLGFDTETMSFVMRDAGRFVRPVAVQVPYGKRQLMSGRHSEIMEAQVMRARAVDASASHKSYHILLLGDYCQVAGIEKALNKPKAVYERIQSPTSEMVLEINRRLAVQELSSDNHLMMFAKSCGQYPVKSVAAHLLALRVKVIGYLASVNPTTHVFNSLDTIMASLEHARSANTIDPRQGSWMWLLVYESQASIRLRQQDKAAITEVQQQASFAVSLYGSGSYQHITALNAVGTALLSLGETEAARIELETAFTMVQDNAKRKKLEELESLSPSGMMDRNVDVSSALPGYTTMNNLAFLYYVMANKLIPPEMKKRKGFMKPKYPDEALKLINKAIGMLEELKDAKANIKDAALLSDVFNNLGSAQLLLFKYNEAATNLRLALKLAEGLYPEKHPDRLSALRNIQICDRRRTAHSSLILVCFYRKMRAKAELRKRRNTILLQRTMRGYKTRLGAALMLKKTRNVGKHEFDWE